MDDRDDFIVYVIERIEYKQDYGCDISCVVTVCATEELAEKRCAQLKEETGIHHQYEEWEVEK